jgi:hypothetical protein
MKSAVRGRSEFGMVYRLKALRTRFLHVGDDLRGKVKERGKETEDPLRVNGPLYVFGSINM